MKVLSIFGARPQFIKASLVSKELRKDNTEILVHTGQHYDFEMSDVFFSQMNIPNPDYNLGVGSGPHGKQTGEMLIRIEEVLETEHPDWVLVYGDTNSTLAGALASAKRQIPVAHVEAGLRSFNRAMPEEHNRVLADHCSDLLFCPTQTAVENLSNEGIKEGVYLTGDVMYDAVLQFTALAEEQSTIHEDLKLNSKEYLLATIHRPYNADNIDRMQSIMDAFIEIDMPIVFPMHPRTRMQMPKNSLEKLKNSNIRLISPVSYFDMLMVEKHAQVILTDSGGVQKEAYFFGVPCITLRTETEWVETVRLGWNVVVGTDFTKIAEIVHERIWPKEMPPNIFGNGQASERIARILGNNQAVNLPQKT
jgi:UDP-N-acetylglucosamine 2-epimerase